MKDKKDWSWRTIFAVFGLIVCVAWFILAVDTLSADFKPPAFWGEGVDSAKWYVTFPSGSAWGGTPAGAVRTDCGRYDTTFTGLSNDTALFFSLKIWDGGSDSASTWIFYWPILYSGTGSGDNAVRYYAVDTSGTDEAVARVQMTMKTIGGTFDATGPTNASGYRDFTAPTANMVTYGKKLGYFFKYDTTDFIGDSTDTIIGYNVPLQPSPDPNLCRVQGYVFVPGGAPERTVAVTFTVSGEAVHNDCDGTAFIAEPVTVWTSIHADSLGFFYADLVPSGCLIDSKDDSLQYKITTELRGVTGKEDFYWIPQAESFEVVW